jgi:CHAD domain-containing protein
MKPEKLLRRWTACLRAFDASLAGEWELCRRTGDVESIHRLRVMLRRGRVYLRLGNSILGKEEVEAFRAWSTKVSNTVARVRDCDVAMAWLQTQPESVRIYQSVSARRKRLWESARRRLPRFMDMPLKPLAKRPRKPQWARRLAAKFSRTFDRDRGEIQAFSSAIDTADAEHWHQLRRDLRRLRYLRELCVAPRAQPKDALLAGLIRMQELLGNAQNCVAALALLPKKAPCPCLETVKDALETARRDWLRQAGKEFHVFQRSRPLAKARLVK